MKQLYGVDMEQTQRSKLLWELPPVDIVITMGCNVSCPSLPCRYREDWGLDDPTGKDDECFLEVIHSIEKKVFELKRSVENGLLLSCKTIALQVAISAGAVNGRDERRNLCAAIDRPARSNQGGQALLGLARLL